MVKIRKTLFNIRIQGVEGMKHLKDLKDRIAFLCNPRAKNGKPKQKEEIIGIGRKLDGFIAMLTSAGDVVCALEGILEQQRDVIILLGGDGTIRNFIQKVMDKNRQDIFQHIKILPLPCGTMNLISKFVTKSSVSPIKILEKYLSGEFIPVSVPTICLEQNNENKYGFFLIFGAVAKIMHEKYDDNHSFPKAVKTFIASYLAAIFNWPASYASLMKPMTLDDFMVDGKPVMQPQTLGVIVSSFRELIFGFQPFMHGDQNDLKILSYDISARELVLPWNFFKIAYGKINPLDQRYYNAPLQSAEIITGENCINLDGNNLEIIPNVPVSISQGPILTFLGKI